MAVADESTVEIPRAILEELIFAARESPTSTNTARNAADAAEFILQDAPLSKSCESTMEIGSYILSCGIDADHAGRHQDSSQPAITWTDEQARKDLTPQAPAPQSFSQRILEEVEPSLPVTLDQLRAWRDGAERKRRAATKTISTFVAFARFYDEHRAILEPVLKVMGPSRTTPPQQLQEWVDRLERGSSIKELVSKYIKS